MTSESTSAYVTTDRTALVERIRWMVATSLRQSGERRSERQIGPIHRARVLAMVWLWLAVAGQTWAATPRAAARVTTGAESPTLALSSSTGDGLATIPGEVVSLTPPAPPVTEMETPPPPAEVVEYYAVDAIGSTRVVFAADGTVLGRGDYLPFGEELPGANLPPERFTGQRRDAEAGLDFFNARYYAPRFGRFSAPDPLFSGAMQVPQLWNRYGYAMNSPFLLIDPSGMQLQEPGAASGCPLVEVPIDPGHTISVYSCGFMDFGGVSAGGAGGWGGGGWTSPEIGCPFCSGVIVGWGYRSGHGQKPSTTPPTTGESAPQDGPNTSEPPPPPPPPPNGNGDNGNPGNDGKGRSGSFLRCYQEWKLSSASIFKNTGTEGVVEAFEVGSVVSSLGDLAATAAKMSRPGMLGTKNMYASGLNWIARRLAVGATRGVLTSVGGAASEVLAVVGTFTLAYEGTVAAQCGLGILQ